MGFLNSDIDIDVMMNTYTLFSLLKANILRIFTKLEFKLVVSKNSTFCL